VSRCFTIFASIGEIVASSRRYVSWRPGAKQMNILLAGPNVLRDDAGRDAAQAVQRVGHASLPRAVVGGVVAHVRSSGARSYSR
jgi:hypothetical protein